MSRENSGGVATGEHRASRRDLLRSLAVAGVGLGTLGAVAAAQDREEDVETFVMAVSESGWQGVAPAGIADVQNPTLSLEEESTYRLVWRNADGRPHALSILDQEGFEMPALRVLAVASDEITVFDDPTANASETVPWENVSTARVGYLALRAGPAQDTETALAVQDVSVVNDTANETAGGEEAAVELVETSPVVMDQGAVQAVEFVADASMASYLDPTFPGTSEGAIEVAGAEGANVTMDENETTDGNVTVDVNATADGNATTDGNVTTDGNATTGGNASDG